MYPCQPINPRTKSKRCIFLLKCRRGKLSIQRKNTYVKKETKKCFGSTQVDCKCSDYWEWIGRMQGWTYDFDYRTCKCPRQRRWKHFRQIRYSACVMKCIIVETDIVPIRCRVGTFRCFESNMLVCIGNTLRLDWALLGVKKHLLWNDYGWKDVLKVE